MGNNPNIRIVNPKDLSENDFLRLNEVTQDMWAEGIGEFIQCDHCKKMMSKRDIFGHLEKELYDETVQKIMRILNMNSFSCPECHNTAHFMYGKENVKNIKERLLTSKDSFLVTCENETGEIVGYMDGYVETLDTIYDRELQAHYEQVGLGEIKARINSLLGYIPEEMLSFSSMGLLGKYANFFTIFAIYKAFSQAVPLDYLNTPGITELDKNNNLHFIYKNMLSLSLQISEDPNLKDKIANTGESYDSDLVIFKKPLKNFLENFSYGIKHFLRNIKP